MSKAGTTSSMSKIRNSAPPHFTIGPPCTPLYSFTASVGQSIRPIIGLSGLCLL